MDSLPTTIPQRSLNCCGRPPMGQPLLYPALLLLAGCLPAGWGGQAAIGPVVGYVRGRGVSVGWEGGAAEIPGATTDKPNLLLHFNLGMSWRPASKPGAPSDRLDYVAWEPVLYVVPITLGYGHSREEKSNPIVGAWAGSPAPAFGSGSCPDLRGTLFIAAGWRWSGVSEFYLTPKIGFLA